MSEGFKENLDRMNEDDALLIADIVTRGLKGEFGKFLLAMLEQLKAMELQNSRARSENSDKVLGRLEAYETVAANLEAYIKQAEELRTPTEEEDLSASEIANEQKEPLRGGAI